MDPNKKSLLMTSLPASVTSEFLIRRALTHRSYLNENREVLEDNERLEFLGDAILAFVVGDWLYKRYPEKQEGFLTKIRAALVHTHQLAAFARRVGLGNALYLGKGEEMAGGRDRDPILCDAFEALIAAIYIDAGLDAVREFVLPMIESEAEKIVLQRGEEDVKSRLQEWAQAQGYGSPQYSLIAESGPDHNKTFTVAVHVHEKIAGVGSGLSKQSAEKEAAAAAIKKLDISDV